MRDSTALEQQRASLVARSVVQVIDQEQTQALKQRLEQQLLQLQEVTNTGSGDRIGPVNLSDQEKRWLERRSEWEHLTWDEAVRSTADRMLSQGLVSNLAIEQLRKAADQQLKAVALQPEAARTLAGKVLTSAMRGSSCLLYTSPSPRD